MSSRRQRRFRAVGPHASRAEISRAYHRRPRPQELQGAFDEQRRYWRLAGRSFLGSFIIAACLVGCLYLFPALWRLTVWSSSVFVSFRFHVSATGALGAFALLAAAAVALQLAVRTADGRPRMLSLGRQLVLETFANLCAVAALCTATAASVPWSINWKALDLPSVVGPWVGAAIVSLIAIDGAIASRLEFGSSMDHSRDLWSLRMKVDRMALYDVLERPTARARVVTAVACVILGLIILGMFAAAPFQLFAQTTAVAAAIALAWLLAVTILLGLARANVDRLATPMGWYLRLVAVLVWGMWMAVVIALSAISSQGQFSDILREIALVLLSAVLIGGVPVLLTNPAIAARWFPFVCLMLRSSLLHGIASDQRKLNRRRT